MSSRDVSAVMLLVYSAVNLLAPKCAFMKKTIVTFRTSLRLIMLFSQTTSALSTAFRKHQGWPGPNSFKVELLFSSELGITYEKQFFPVQRRSVLGSHRFITLFLQNYPESGKAVS